MQRMFKFRLTWLEEILWHFNMLRRLQIIQNPKI